MRTKIVLVVCMLLFITMLPAAHAVPTPERGWVKNTILEQFGITATEVYQSISFTGDTEPNRVENGYPSGGYCYTSAFPGWYIESCDITDYYGTGPSVVWVQAEAEFRNVQCLSSCAETAHYTQMAHWFDNVNSGWGYVCTLPDGSLPVFWEMDCDGAKGVTGPPYEPPPVPNGP